MSSTSRAAEYRDRYWMLVAAKLCVKCKKPILFGRRCRKHLLSERDRQKRRRESSESRAAEPKACGVCGKTGHNSRSHGVLRTGVCPGCAGPMAITQTKCDSCVVSRKGKRAAKRSAADAKRLRDRARAGVCRRCGKKERDDRIDGRLFVNCMECRIRCARLERARRARSSSAPIRSLRCSRCGESGHQKPTCMRHFDYQVSGDGIEQYALSRSGSQFERA